MTANELHDMLIAHKQYYYEDLHDLSSDKSAMFAERIIRGIGISMKANLGEDFYKAYGIIDDHVEEMIKTETAVKKLFDLVEELKQGLA